MTTPAVGGKGVGEKGKKEGGEERGEGTDRKNVSRNNGKRRIGTRDVFKNLRVPFLDSFWKEKTLHDGLIHLGTLSFARGFTQDIEVVSGAISMGGNKHVMFKIDTRGRRLIKGREL